MSTRILILKDGVITPSRSSTDNTAIVNSLGTSLVTSVNGSTGVITLSKSSVGLGLVDNTSDLSKPISTSTQSALNTKADLVGGLIPSSQLPGYVDDVLEFTTLSSFPTTGESGKIYVAIDTNLTYRWTGSVYSNMSSSLALGITATTAYRGDFGNTAYNHSQITTGNPHGTTAANIGLGNIVNSLQLVASNNLSDLVSRQTALNNIVGAVTTGTYLRGNGTNVLLSTIQASDIPTLNQNTTGTASSVTGIITITNGGTGASTQQAAINALVGNQTANRVLRSNGVNMILAQVGLTTDVVDVLPIANGGTGSATQNFVGLTGSQTIAGSKKFTSAVQIQSAFPGFLLDETGSKSLYLVLDGGVVQMQRLAEGGGAYEAAPLSFNLLNGNVSLTSTTQTTSTTTGALTVAGGVGIAGGLCANLPTSSAGLTAGMFWRNGNVVNIV